MPPYVAGPVPGPTNSFPDTSATASAPHRSREPSCKPRRDRNVPGGVYEITKLLPHNGSESNIASRVQPKRLSELREKAN